MAQAKLASGLAFSPVVLSVQLTPAESAVVLRYTGRRVTQLEFTENELKSLAPAGPSALLQKHYDIKQVKGG